MADTLATLIVKLVADTADIVTGIDKANTKFDSLVGTVGKIGAALGVAFSARAVIGAIQDALAYGDALQTLSEKTNISVESLQVMERMAKGANTTLEVFSNAALELSRRLASGDASAAHAAGQLGLNVEKLIAMRPDQAFASVAVRLGLVADEGDRAAVAQDLMGKTARDLLPLMTTGYADVAREAAAAANTISGEHAQALSDAKKTVDTFVADATATWTKFAANVINGFQILFGDRVGLTYEEAMNKMVAATRRGHGDIQLSSDETTRKQVGNIEIVTLEEQKALDKRATAHRSYLNWVYEREIEHAAAVLAEKKKAEDEYRDYRNMIGELLMQEDRARMEAENKARAEEAARLMQEPSLIEIGVTPGAPPTSGPTSDAPGAPPKSGGPGSLNQRGVVVFGGQVSSAAPPMFQVGEHSGAALPFAGGLFDLAQNRGAAPTVHVNVGHFIGSDRSAATQLAKMVGDEIMRNSNRRFSVA